MKIFVADPNSEVQSALSFILQQSPGVNILGQTCDMAQLITLTLQECPDLILIDPEIAKPFPAHRRAGSPCSENIFTLLHKICPGVKVVAMSSRSEVKREALTAGADGFISKTDPPEIIMAWITAVLSRGHEE